MKAEFYYERRQSANRMEAIMIGVSSMAILAAIFAFFRGGWLPSVVLLVLALVAFALARVFDLFSDLFASIASADEGTKRRVADENLEKKQ